MPTIIEDAVYRNNKMREWVLSTYPEDEARQQAAWETFFAIRQMFPETEVALRGERVSGGTTIGG